MNSVYTDQGKPKEVRLSNMVAARAMADAVRTSLGPKGMDKMVRPQANDDPSFNLRSSVILKIIDTEAPFVIVADRFPRKKMES